MIYTITQIGMSDRWFLNDEDHKFFKRKVVDSRCVGYYETLIEALNVVERNAGGFHECLWEYLVVENFQPGIYTCSNDDHEMIWFKHVGGFKPWDQIEGTPTEFKGLIGFGIAQR